MTFGLATDEAPTERVLNWGAEMARVHFHVQESLPKMIEKYGPFDDLMIQLEDRLETLGKVILNLGLSPSIANLWE